jgi:hypothetical protein
VEKRFSHNFSGEITYGYMLATGVASDPNLERTANLLYLPISEQFLDWDQRHTLRAQLLLSRPNDWVASLIWTYGSGFPFTPTSRNERRIDPSKTNAGRLPSLTNLTIQADKRFQVWGQEMRIFLRGNNVLDARSILDLEPENSPTPPGTNSSDYLIFYSETGRAGGAYLGEDLDGDGVEDWIPVNDPRVFHEGRSLKVGLGIRF